MEVIWLVLLSCVALAIPTHCASREEVNQGQFRAAKEGFAAAERIRDAISECSANSEDQITQDIATITASIEKIKGFREQAKGQYRDLLPVMNGHIRGLEQLLQASKNMQRRSSLVQQDHQALTDRMEQMAAATPGIASPKCPLANCLSCPAGDSCEKCRSGAVLTAQGECATCGEAHPFCLTCNDDNRCVACEKGVTLNADGECRNEDIWPHMTEVQCGDGTLDGILLVSTSNPANNFRGYGTVCDDGFSYNSAAVACRNLGFTGGTFRKYGAFRSFKYETAIEQVVCPADASLMSQCTHAGWRNDDCSKKEDVVLKCTYDGNRSPPVTDVDTKQTITCTRAPEK